MKRLVEAPLQSVQRMEDPAADVADQTSTADRTGDDWYDDTEFPDEENGASDAQVEDPDRQGYIRTVPNAHLIYKRKDQNHQYTELWVYKRDSNKTATLTIYDAIISGTDIPRGDSSSEDGSQTVSTWEIGPIDNTVCYVEIKGLSN